MNRTPKLYAISVFAMVLLLALVLPVMAKNIDGTITTITPDNYVFTVLADEDLTHEFRLSVDGQVFINDQERTIWDLQVGDRVVVTYEIEYGGAMVVTLVRCTR